jgi:hypothetical protein
MSEKEAPLEERLDDDFPQTGITVLDLLKAIFTPEDIIDRRERVELAEEDAEPEPIVARVIEEEPASETASVETDTSQAEASRTPTLSSEATAPLQVEAVAAEESTAGHRLALILGTTGTLVIGYVAQRSLSIGRQDTLGVILYALAAFLWLGMLFYEFGPPGDRWAWLPQPKRPTLPVPGDVDRRSLMQRLLEIEPPRLYLAAGGLSLSALTYVATANNHFTLIGVVAWLSSIAIWIIVLSEQPIPPELNFLGKARTWLRRPSLMRMEPFAVAALLVLGLAAFYRFFQLDAVPPEMTSDHVEKLLDAYRVQNGQYLVFFPNNGGREAFQMYFVALMADLLGTGMSFTSLKLASALEGLALIPVMILLGKELIDRQTGLMAGLLVAFSWWHVSLSRMGLRIALTPLIMSLALITLLRGLRSGERKHFIATGIWLGVGVYSYQAMRIAPLVVVMGVALAMFTPDADRRWRQRLLGNLIIAGVVAFVIFVPMGRFWADSPETLWGRVINRTTSSEVAIAGSPFAIFISNLGNALLMFNWKGDVAWISAIPTAPLLDIVSGSLFILGLLAWAVRLAVRRDPVEGIVPLAIVILILPSALAIAFPIENPSATRASGVIPLVYLLAAWPLALIRERWTVVMGKSGRRLALATILALSFIAALFNYDAYFYRYRDSYTRSALNPSEVGTAVAGFSESIGSLDNAYLQGYPFWHDYRAIGIEAGEIGWDNAIFDADHLRSLLTEDPHFTDGSAKLFVVHPDDEEGRAVLEDAYPEGQFILKQSAVPNRDFYIFVVPVR